MLSTNKSIAGCPVLLGIALLFGFGSACSGDSGEAGGADASTSSCLGDICERNEDCPCSNTCLGGSCAASLDCNEIHISWTTPVENEDDSCYRTLGGYKMHYGDVSGTYTDTVDVGMPCYELGQVPCGPDDATQMQYRCDYIHQFPTDVQGARYFALTSYSSTGLESVYSEEVTKEFDCE